MCRGEFEERSSVGLGWSRVLPLCLRGERTGVEFNLRSLARDGLVDAVRRNVASELAQRQAGRSIDDDVKTLDASSGVNGDTAERASIECWSGLARR